MIESILPALSGMITTAKAMALFDAFRKGRRGDIRALIEELKENSRLCFHVVNDGIDHKTVISKFSTGHGPTEVQTTLFKIPKMPSTFAP